MTGKALPSTAILPWLYRVLFSKIKNYQDGLLVLQMRENIGLKFKSKMNKKKGKRRSKIIQHAHLYGGQELVPHHTNVHRIRRFCGAIYVFVSFQQITFKLRSSRVACVQPPPPLPLEKKQEKGRASVIHRCQSCMGIILHKLKTIQFPPTKISVAHVSCLKTPVYATYFHRAIERHVLNRFTVYPARRADYF